MDIIPREVLEELKCPVCVEYMTPPIPMCQNGHNICNTCRQRVDECPICRDQFLESRCWLLENIIQIMKYRCQYYTEGCEYVYTAHFIESHEDNCSHRPFNCPFSVMVTKNFCWRGHINDMWAHILCKHTALAVPEAENSVFTVDSAAPGPLHRALSKWGETFIMVCRVINMDLYCCVLYVGPQERASFYKYWVAVATKDGSGFATVGLPTKSYFVDAETLFKTRECTFFSHAFWDRRRSELSSSIMSFKVDIKFK
jgi:hypothetical protein